MGAPLTINLDLTHQHHRNALRAFLDAYDRQPEPAPEETAEQFAIADDEEPQPQARLMAPEPEPKKVEEFEVIETETAEASEPETQVAEEPATEREPGEDDEPAPPSEVTEISLDDFTARFKEIYRVKGEEASKFLRGHLTEYGVQKVNSLNAEQRVAVFNALTNQFDSVPF